MKTRTALIVVLVLGSCRTVQTVGPLGVTVGTKIQAVTFPDGARIVLPPNSAVTEIDGSWVTLRGSHSGRYGTSESKNTVNLAGAFAWEPWEGADYAWPGEGPPKKP
jgi:hypothetical protein